MSRRKNKKNENITIKHIAKASGFSFSTVGRVFRNDPAVSVRAKKIILKTAKELNYYPNSMAKGLRSKKSKIIGVILNDLTNPLYYETIEEIENKTREFGYTLILSDSKYNIDIEKDNISTMFSRNVDGLIFSPVNTESANIDMIIDNGINAVFIDAHPTSKEINYVYVNHQKASYRATEYLIKNGHRKILLLNGPSILSSSKAFLDGYKEALTKYNIEFNDKLLHLTNISIEESCKEFINIYKEKFDILKFSAAICISDLIAIGIYKAQKRLKIKIPKDLSVIGYDNIFISEFLNPPLSTVHAPKKTVGKKAVEIILSRINEETDNYCRIELEPKMLVRKSISKIN